MLLVFARYIQQGEIHMDIVTIGEVSIDLAPPVPLRWMLPPAPKS